MRLTTHQLRRWPRIPSTQLRLGLIGLGCVSLVAAAMLAVGSNKDSSSGLHDIVIAARNLPAGLTPGPRDVRLVRVRAESALPSQWFSRDNLGRRALTSSVSRGSVLLTSDFTGPLRAKPIVVSVPVERGHVPVDLRRGDVVDLWFTPDDVALMTGGSSAQLSRRVMSGVAVCSVHPGELSGDSIVEVCLPASGVGPVVQATRAGSIDVVRSGGSDDDV